ncbi:MAG TPA: outer membrane beta-barrel protein [Catalimonadaceae bacterium]|nr:outer membrane beta-barrel protein [Catalimonadaceae bacterium]
MKKLIVALALGALALSSYAQDAKPGAGKMFLAGSLGYSRSTPEVNKNAPDPEASSTITFSPSFGYFLNDGFALGARLAISKDMMKDMEGGLTLGFGAFARMYSPLSDNFYMFGEGALGYASSTPQYAKGASEPDAATTFGFGVAPGFGYYPGKHFGIEFTLPSLLGIQTTKSNKDNNSGMNFQLGVSTLAQPVSLTVVYFLN